MQTISCQPRLFGTLPTGETITCYYLRNASGMAINVLDYGATLNSVQIPDSRGNMHEIMSGLNSLDDYLTHNFYPGILLGHLYKKSGTSLLNFHQLIWKAENISHADAASIQFSLTAPIAHYMPRLSGEFTFKMTYTLTSANQLSIRCHLESEKAIPIGLSYHPHWNLSGQNQDTIAGHVLQLWANQYMLIGAKGLPQTPPSGVKDSPFDFLKPQHINESLSEALTNAQGELCFILDSETHEQPKAVQLAASLKEPISGRTLEVHTNQSGLTLYTDVPQMFKSPSLTEKLGSICLSPQNLSIMKTENNATTVLNSSTMFEQETTYQLIW